MAPIDQICPDWVFCISSNIHVCRDRAWFVEYTPFSTYVSCDPSSPDLGVLGVGTVLVPVESTPGAAAPTHLRLVSVLHAPSARANLIGGMAVMANGGSFSLGGSQDRGGLYDASGRQVAYFSRDAANPRLMAIKLWGSWPSGRIQHGALEPAVVTGTHWASQERERWCRFVERLKILQQAPVATKRKASLSYDADPCGAEERRQCKRQLNGGYRLPMQHSFPEANNSWDTRQQVMMDVMVE
ncbi:uncharacterized protein PgNI_08045 [Pyricularia grisea]|uniref:Retrovirus-related Pol polyprotein from transposon TNT 1-94-like beta-barrel domain-containing protein n=1 Tax=Pyricularia grisea TaxID=148305 RepID=A0A6P8AVK1_PYRGI|nr:uncharacterized protein PgNI_08045 [Pyricularia grisea]TLD06227.1 hypothetical protein PgNI_08045 [Pyricularia grisea]